MKTQHLRDEAISIWQAGVDAVRTDRLVEDRVRRIGNSLEITACDGATHVIQLEHFDRVCVVGAGKAAGNMAAAVERLLTNRYPQADNLFGWVNVPEGAAAATQRITLHACRPQGTNEPTPAVVEGTLKILQLVRSLGPRDLCLVLLTGGGSALLTAPNQGLTLEDILSTTRMLVSAGADIHQLNRVRRQLSQVKGGRLAAACRADHTVGLILSDVLGDDLEIIASGPTTFNEPQQAAKIARETIQQLVKKSDSIPANVRQALLAVWEPNSPIAKPVTNIILANNQTAVRAAAVKAEQLGYIVEVLPVADPQPLANELGVELANQCLRLNEQSVKRAIISGGEPTVQLADASERGQGGRNQQAILAGLIKLAAEKLTDNPLLRSVILSGGTDGEDGPTDAAGAAIGKDQFNLFVSNPANALAALQLNDAYPLLSQNNALMKTGLTHTNVCDLCIVLHDPA